MAARGPYSKGVAKRAEILDAALDIVERSGYTNATVRELADAVGLSQNGLLHYFGSKAALFTEIIRHGDELGLAAMGRGDTPISTLREALVEMTRTNLDRDGFAELNHRLAAEATDPGHESHAYIAYRQATQVRLVAQSFRELKAQGRLRPDADPDKLALMVWGLIDGLTGRRLLDPGLDVPGLIEHFFDLVTV